MSRNRTIPPMGKATLEHIKVMTGNIEEYYRSAYSILQVSDQEYLMDRLEVLHTTCEQIEKSFKVGFDLAMGNYNDPMTNKLKDGAG